MAGFGSFLKGFGEGRDLAGTVGKITGHLVETAVSNALGGGDKKDDGGDGKKEFSVGEKDDDKGGFSAGEVFSIFGGGKKDDDEGGFSAGDALSIFGGGKKDDDKGGFGLSNALGGGGDNRDPDTGAKGSGESDDGNNKGGEGSGLDMAAGELADLLN